MQSALGLAAQLSVSLGRSAHSRCAEEAPVGGLGTWTGSSDSDCALAQLVPRSDSSHTPLSKGVVFFPQKLP